VEGILPAARAASSAVLSVFSQIFPRRSGQVMPDFDGHKQTDQQKQHREQRRLSGKF
jgi:hypothetical protein